MPPWPGTTGPAGMNAAPRGRACALPGTLSLGMSPTASVTDPTATQSTDRAPDRCGGLAHGRVCISQATAADMDIFRGPS